MATTIKLKSGSGAPLAGDLVAAEPAFDLTNKRLYTENASGTVIEVGTNPTSLTTGTFTSTGIDDNATSTAITIDSSQNTFFSSANTHAASVNVASFANTTTGQPVAIAFGAVADNGGAGNEGGIYFDAGADGSAADNQLQFNADHQSSITPDMVITGSGNVGIGTSSPTFGLSVESNNGSGYAALFRASSSDPALTIQTTSSITQIQGLNSALSATNDIAMQLSGGNVGIGTAIPTHDLTVGSTSASDYVIALRGGVGGFFGWDDSANTTIVQAPNTRSLSFQVNSDTFSAGTEAMRIDTSGNLLVGKTAASGFTLGAEIKADGTGQFTVDNNPPLYANRKSSDGNIIVFAKDNTTVGSIGTTGGQIHLDGASGEIGLYMGTNNLYPRKNAALADNAVDIGQSSYRFKDLYLSGGAYLGGTGSANYLDDYEEGDHTCTVTMGSGSCSLYSNYDKIKYTKIGNLVTIQGQIRVESVSSPSGEMRVSMPFSINTTDDEGSNVSGSLIRTYLGNAPTGGLFLHGTMVFNQGNQCVVQWSKSGSATVNHVPIAGEYLVFNFSYRAA